MGISHQTRTSKNIKKLLPTSLTASSSQRPPINNYYYQPVFAAHRPASQTKRIPTPPSRPSHHLAHLAVLHAPRACEPTVSRTILIVAPPPPSRLAARRPGASRPPVACATADLRSLTLQPVLQLRVAKLPSAECRPALCRHTKPLQQLPR